MTCNTTVLTTRQVVSTLITAKGGNKTLVTAGAQGVAASDLGTTVTAIENIVKDTIHANAADEGIIVDTTGNIRLSIGTLQTLP